MSNPRSAIAQLDEPPNLSALYDYATDCADQALQAVIELSRAIDSELDHSEPARRLQELFERIAATNARIQTSQQGPDSAAAGDLALASAERHLSALNRLCLKIREAELAAALRLRQLSPQLDASIRGKEMILAYRQHSA